MLRTVKLPGFDKPQSVVGFGCASLGSRIAPSAGERALEQGYDAGVTWYDVAPPYGAGEAEEILGRFLRRHRNDVTVCTKVGLAPPARNELLKAAYTVGRPVVRALGAARRAFRRVQATRNVHLPLTPQLIESSIEQSLRKLGTDHVDVLALHDPDPGDVVRDDVVEALARVKAKGQALRFGVAGKIEACLAGLGADLPFTVLQTADDLRETQFARLKREATRPIATISHSVLGVDGALHRIVSRLKQDTGRRDLLAAAGYRGPLEDAVASLLVDRSFATNREGVVLLSMFSASHLQKNLASASAPVNEAAPDLVRQLLSDAQAG